MGIQRPLAESSPSHPAQASQLSTAIGSGWRAICSARRSGLAHRPGESGTSHPLDATYTYHPLRRLTYGCAGILPGINRLRTAQWVVSRRNGWEVGATGGKSAPADSKSADRTTSLAGNARFTDRGRREPSPTPVRDRPQTTRRAARRSDASSGDLAVV